MTHYGDHNHRMRHFMFKGGGIVFLLAGMPALTHVPDPERLFYLGIAVGLGGWFSIIAFAELGPKDHFTRLWVHLAVMLWIALTVWYYPHMVQLDSQSLRGLYILATAGAWFPLVAFGSHLKRYLRHLAEERAEGTADAQPAATPPALGSAHG